MKLLQESQEFIDFKEVLFNFAIFVTGKLIDRTQVFTYVFLACSISVTLSALFLMISFYWLDRRDAAQKDNGS